MSLYTVVTYSLIFTFLLAAIWISLWILASLALRKKRKCDQEGCGVYGMGKICSQDLGKRNINKLAASRKAQQLRECAQWTLKYGLCLTKHQFINYINHLPSHWFSAKKCSTVVWHGLGVAYWQMLRTVQWPQNLFGNFSECSTFSSHIVTKARFRRRGC